MEAGGKDCEEETLQTAFKKLRVDAESLPGAASVSEALTPRTTSRVCLDGSGAKSKLGCPKDNWHCCTRKTRGASRTQRRRRSKSPILHPPRFTYCSSATTSALSPPAGCLKHRHPVVPEAPEPRPAADELTGSSLTPPAQTELCCSGTSGNISPLLFGSCGGYDTQLQGVVSSPSLPEVTTATSSRWDGGNSGDVRSSEGGSLVKSACEGAESGAAEAADFRALSELHRRGSCSCSHRSASDSQEESVQEPRLPCSCRSHRQGWNGMEVYSFTGLRGVISECERSLPSQEDACRTLSSNATASSPSSSSPALSSGSPRSCSEQARAYVDDITIEDLSGYMEYYLYIPKKMSHMAEMMYT